MTDLTQATDSFNRIYYYDDEATRNISIRSDQYDAAVDRIYDLRGLLAFMLTLRNTDTFNRSFSYTIQETTRHFTSIDDIDDDEWFTVAGHDDVAVATLGARSVTYSKLLSSGVRAVRVRLRTTLPNTFSHTRIDVIGEL